MDTLAYILHTEQDSEGCEVQSVPVTIYGTGTSASWPDDVALTGQITVTTAGAAVNGPDTSYAKKVALKAHPDNMDTVWYGNDGGGDVDNTNGFPLNPGEGLILKGSLSQYWFDSDVNGGKFCWGVVD